MPEVFKQVFKVHPPSACALGVLAGFALSLPAGSSDLPSSLLSGGMGLSVVTMPGATSETVSLAYVEDGTDLQALFEQGSGQIMLGGTFHLEGRDLASSGHDGEVSRQLRLLAGYDFGRTVGYVTVGQDHQGAGPNLSRSQVYGVGLQVSLNRALQMAGEILHETSNSAVPGQDTGQEVLSIGAAFRF